jgi:division/cell wall cluster transcriptional repressor MraZ
VDQTGQDQTLAIENPRGTHEIRVDSKGRLKLPAVFKGYFETIQEKSFFVTTTDRKLLYVYPLSVWKQNERSLEAMTGTEDEMEAAESVMFTANRFGGDAAIDGEGRVLIPQELRKELGLNDSPVWVVFEKGKLVGYNELEYKKRCDASSDDLGGKLKTVKLKGFR